MYSRATSSSFIAKRELNTVPGVRLFTDVLLKFTDCILVGRDQKDSPE